MKVLNYGSLNVDYVYSVDHIIAGGETQHSSKLEVFSGGKGLNQSIALAKAGILVYHAGIIGNDGDILLDACKEAGVDTRYIRRMPVKGGHTIIQVDKNAQNCIILYGGTNQMQTKEFADEVLADFGEGDYLILQNEINMLDYIIDRAYEKKMKIVMNPSPFDERLSNCDLGKVYLFLLNEIEGEQITGFKDKDQILDAMAEKFPNARFVLTLGSDGAVYYDGKEKIFQDIFKVKAVDTTAAGDTFTGYFVAGMIAGKSIRECLRTAAKASSIAVSRPGAAPSVPEIEEVTEELRLADAKTEPISLRPHHGMCLAYFKGMGYSDGFSVHMQEMLETFQEGAKIRLHADTDEICSACPNNENGCCSSFSLVKKYDKAVLEFCGLENGQVMDFDAFAAKVQKEILSSGKRKEICGKCQWNSICENQRSRWEEYSHICKWGDK